MYFADAMFKDNYNYLLNKSGKSYSDVARFVKCSPQNARDWALKDITPRKNNLERLANFFNVTQEKLLFGSFDGNEEVVVKVGVDLPVLDFAQLGGFLNGSFTPSRGFHCTYDVDPEAFVLIQDGDTMENFDDPSSIGDGEKIIIEPQENVKTKSIVLARIKDTGAYTIRKYISDAGQFFLIPLNKMYNTIPVNDNVEIIGVAKYSIKVKSL